LIILIIFKEEIKLIDARKDIVFRDENYKPKFTIKDGDSIKITVAYDGEEIIRKCRFLDESHMYVGSTCLHMDEFMEKQKRVGNKYEPVPNPEPMLDILFAERGQIPRDVEIPISIDALCELVGGPLDLAPLGKDAMIVRGITGSGTYDKSGAFAICGVNGENLTSLHPYQAQRYKLEYTPREQPAAVITEKKPSLIGRIAEAKKTADTINQKTADEAIPRAGKKKTATEH
jgi:hypothetical protein